MRVIITGGGTAGHINPAIAIATEIRAKNPQSEILYVGSKNGMEKNLAEKAGFKFKEIEASGFLRSFKPKAISHNIKACFIALNAKNEAKKIIKQFKPDICIGTGGYVSGPLILSAQKMNIKTAIHEQNAYPGITTKALSKHADIVFGAVEEIKSRIQTNGKFYVVGNPVREEFIFGDKKKAREKLGVDQDSILILSSGGSLGAQSINRAVAGLIAWHIKKDEIYHIHSKGKKFNSWVFDEKIEQLNIDLSKSKKVIVKEYINDMGLWFTAADLIIGRTGAMSLSEIQCAGKASILIPSPNVTENHQYHNAMVLVKKGAAILIEEKDLTDESLIDATKKILSDKSVLQ
ncbi:MAG: undecaprenyldiphospho-muramoylpentapeptide beta-N-acetylglucosaminyltransferase [Oscillospiraceae bacterium]